MLIELAVSRLFLTHWTDAIHDEWITNLLERRPDLKVTQLERTRAMINQAVPGSLITGFEAITDTLQLPDPEDRHVLAAAIHAGARGIVTFKLKDFPASALGPHGVHAIHPDDFVLAWLNSDTDRVVHAVRAVRTRLRNPALEVLGHLPRLAAQGLPRTAAVLEAHHKSL